MADPAPGAYGAPAPLSDSDSRLWASLAHFGNILGFLPALLIFLIQGPRSTFVRTQAKEALNWIVTLTIVWVALAIVGAVLLAIYLGTPNSGFDVITSLLRLLVTLAQWALVIVNLIFSIVSGLRVNQGGSYRYPFALRLVK